MPLAQIAIALVSGVVLGLLVATIRARGARARLAREVVSRLGPVIERRAALLGIEARNRPAVGLGMDGELTVTNGDPVRALMMLADEVEAREHAQLGYVDTIRVSKEDVDTEMANRRSG